MDSMGDIKQTFFQECEDLLNELEEGLLAMEGGDTDSETVNAVFRAVHSIKGGAGAFGLDALVSFAHTFETTLDAVRSETLEPSADVMSVLLRSADTLADLVRAAKNDAPTDAVSADALIQELESFVGGGANEPAETAPADETADDGIEFTPVAIDINAILGADDASAVQSFMVAFKPHRELYANANEALLLLRGLRALGETEITCDASELPTLDALDPEGAYLSWKIMLSGCDSEDDIREVFEFVDGECTLSIESETLGEDAALDDLLISETAASDESEPPAIEQAEADATSPSDATPPPEQTEPAPKAVEEPQRKAVANREAADTTIRVNLGKVDRLVNLVGELVINQAMLSQGVEEAGIDRELSVESPLEELKQLSREIQESVMAIRAQPIKTLFQRMSRIVREAGHATEKSVRLVTEGEATEVDKTVIERLADPLTHMIRNAVDHGLETPEQRLEAGKPAEGVVSLTAAHRSGRVIIEVRDDGAGINRKRVRQIAVDKGLIDDDAQLSDNEIDNLLFMPGFSTASEVSNLSGRGVGMDVVKRAIQAVGGKISIASTPGKGSTFTISLPLTLAILDGMIVEVANETLVIPLTSIVETLQPNQTNLHSLGGDSSVLSIRGEFIPVVDIGLTMGYRNERLDPLQSVAISVETEDGGKGCLIVDAIQDQRQVVIKSLEENYGNVPGIAAATILGDGRIALILDIETVVAGGDNPQGAVEYALAANG